ncbi:transcriptional regulator [Demequina lutea]|uniref:DNA-binding MarR family transcriptional regulator n=1 Tax=Demequina lutea TaxID=431489 RepID=A0A7Y9ZB00_9MICO|nr:transcriptional regulator [Demequina lutea]NYI41495.1 DNA-binding MarR family transcriptional regulator [Demequina lutea]
MTEEPAFTHPRHHLDDALLTPVRYSAMAALGNGSEVDFATLRDLIETDDSSLSKAVFRLERTGYVAVRKGYVANKPRTWLRPTAAGLKALRVHSAALQAITEIQVTPQVDGEGH